MKKSIRVLLLALITMLMAGCLGDDKPKEGSSTLDKIMDVFSKVGQVKGGHFLDNSTTTIGQAFDASFGNVEWTEKTTSKGQKFVEFKGDVDIDFLELLASAIIDNVGDDLANPFAASNAMDACLGTPFAQQYRAELAKILVSASVASLGLIALDGHRIGVWNLHESDTMASFTIGLGCVGILKSAIGKSDRKILVVCDGKHAKFEGEDFTYIARCIEGNYYDIDKIVGNAKKNYEYKLGLDNKELSEIAKEYKKGFKADDMRPMLFFGNKDGLATSFSFQTFMTADKLENVKWYYYASSLDRFHKAVNPLFIVDACAFLGDEVEIRSTFSSKTPMYLCEGDKEVLILPVNFADTGNRLITLAEEQLTA